MIWAISARYGGYYPHTSGMTGVEYSRVKLSQNGVVYGNADGESQS